MLSIVISFGLAAFQSAEPNAGSWVAKLMHSADALFALHHSVVKPTVATVASVPLSAKSVIPAQDANPNSDPRMLRYIEEGNKVRRKTGDLIDGERLQDAYDYISDVQKSDPSMHDMTEDLVIECALLTGRYDEAFDRSVVLVNTSGWGSPDAYLRLSLASAMKGTVYPGQFEFVQESIQESLSRDQVHDTAAMQLPGTSKSAKGIAVLSCLARGFRSPSLISTGFFEAAIRLDPQNDLAAREAIKRFKTIGRYSGIRRVASVMIANLAPGKSRDGFSKLLEQYRSLKDKPIPTRTTNP